MLGKNAPQSLALGQLGATLIVTAKTSGAVTGSFGRIYCLSETATFAALVTSTIVPATTTVGGEAMTDITLAQGMEIQGLFTSITMATGTVLAYSA